MANKITSSLIHIAMLAVVCAIGAYWGVRILTPQPTAAPPPLAAPPPRSPDPALAARMFGLVQQAQARVATNIQVAGIFAAGEQSAAVLTVDGKPPRVFVLGQEVTAGNRLAEVTAEQVVLETQGGRQELRVPPARPVASLANGAPARAYVMDGNTLSPTGSGGAPSAVPAPPPVMQPATAPTAQPGVPLRPGVPGDAVVPGQPPAPPPPGGQPAKEDD
jgi:general secretion pathway protein C